jgi:tetratricopeptide (TPR) repeat protein
MRRLFALLILAILCLTTAFGQKPDPGPKPQPKQKPQSKAPATPLEKSAEKAPDYSSEAFVLEKWYTTYTFESDGTGKRESYARIKVQSEAGVDQWGQVVIGYSSANEKVEIPYVRVLKADGSVVTAQPDAVQDLSAPLQKEAPVYTDFRQKHITVPGLRPGETLEYDIVTVIHTPLAPGQFWMEHEFIKNGISLDEQLKVDVPRDRTAKLKTRPGVDAKITEANGRRVYLWTSSHLERDDDDNDDVKAKKKKKPTQPEPPAVQMTTFSTWEEMGRWYAGLEKDRRQPTPEIRAKATELTAGKTTDIAKIEALYDYVATNFRYISLSFGVGRYQPHAAGDVLHNQYGDCKDKHTLLASLLEASGFHTSSVLINSSRKLDPDLPSPSQFDHVISLVPLPTEEVWMDTTTEVAPFRLLSSNIRKKEGLVIPAEGTPHLEETPSDPPMRNHQVQQMDGKINEFGKLDAHVNYELRGDTELFIRILFRRVPNSKWPQFVKQMMRMSGLEGEVTDLKVGDPAATKEPFKFEFQLTANNVFDWAKKKSELLLPLSQMTMVDVDEDSLGPGSDPIPLGGPGDYDYKIKLQLPAKYTAKAPLPFSMKRDYAQYEASYKVEDNVFTAERKLDASIREIPASRSSDYLAFRRAVAADTAQRLSIDSTAAGNPTAPKDLKGDDLEDAAKAALERGNFQIAIDLLKRVVEAEPKHKTAWMSLGRAYMGLKQTDQAVACFKKQAENNPYDEYAYNSLGWAYTTDRKYDDAATAYGKAIEINPLSEYAHASLGSMYSEIKKYDKAVPELEKAVSLKPDNAFWQVSLGDAYLNTGQDEKAMAAFDQAVEISATPVIWNNIAYQLSLKKVHLDRAQQYAESAVAATAAGLRNVNLNQLNERDLGLVMSLASYWDTLGWVHFAKGEADTAEKYLASAWSLSQHADIGDHLGQLYEKEGKKEEAVRYYALSLASSRPDPETRDRLTALLGDNKKANAAIDKHRLELQEARTVKLGKATQTGNAEFFVLMGSNGAGKLEGVKFVGGDEKLRAYAETLRGSKLELKFPDDVATKILRRGVVSCSELTKECIFVMTLPEDVRSID